MGSDASTWEESIIGDYAGEWEELSGWGKAGYVIGSGIGMLPSFGTASVVGRGALTASKIGTKGLTKKAKKEVLESGLESLKGQGKRVTGSFEEGYEKVVDKAFDTMAQGSDVKKFLKGPADAWFTPMVEEYMMLIRAGELEYGDELDVEELNGWIEHELSSLHEGYKEWNNGNG